MQPEGLAPLVIVAPGSSQGMGQAQQWLPIHERSSLRRAVEIGVASMCRPIVVVTGAYEEAVRHELRALPIMIISNRKRADRCRSPLCAAMDALAALDAIDGAVIMLCDQPLVSAEALNRIVEAHYTTGKDIVASEYDDTCGAPLYIGRRFFGEIRRSDGRVGPRCIIDRHLQDVVTISHAGSTAL